MQQRPLAYEDFFAATRCNTNYSEAYESIARLAWEDRNYTNSIANLSAVIRANPKATNAFKMRALGYLQTGQISNAISELLHVTELDSGDSYGFLLLGQAFRVLGDLAIAETNFSNAISRDPKLADAYEGRGTCRFDRGDPTTAVQDLSTAIRLNPKSTNAFKFRGQAFLEIGEYASAVDDLSQYIVFNPTDPKAFVFRAVGRIKLKDNVSAEKDLATAQTFTNESAVVQQAKVFSDFLKLQAQTIASRNGVVVGLQARDLSTNASHNAGFLVQGEKLLYLSTSASVANRMNSNAAVEFRGSSDRVIRASLAEMSVSSTEAMPIWVYHSRADCAIAPLLLGSKTDPEIIRQFRNAVTIPLRSLATLTDAPPMPTSIVALGQPVSKTTPLVFSPQEMTTTTASDISTDANGTRFVVLQDSIPQGCLGGPAFDSIENQITIRSNLIRMTPSTSVWGLASESTESSSGQRIARIVHISHVVELIRDFESRLNVGTNSVSAQTK